MKIINVAKASMDKILKNEEIRDIINALGCGVGEGYGNDFDITKLRYNKIIIMSDADKQKCELLNVPRIRNSAVQISLTAGNP